MYVVFDLNIRSPFVMFQCYSLLFITLCNWCDKQGPVIKIHSCLASLAPPFIGLLSFSFYFMMPAAAGWSAVLGWAGHRQYNPPHY